jgi:type II secretory pathway pseudopilin PulG
MIPRRASGFTVIEIVIAIALSVSMIVSIYSATQAMSNTAIRQKELSAQDMRRERFVEILRHDLRGWAVQNQPSAATPTTPATSPGADSDQPLLKFNTTADALSGSMQGAVSCPRAIANLQYVLRKSPSGFELIRMESSPSGSSSELRLIQSAEAPKVEFYYGSKWSSQWTGKQRPPILRLTIAGRVQVIAN